MPHDQYGSDVLAGDWRKPANGRTTEQTADLGLVVEDVTTGWCGEIVRVDPDLGTVDLEDRHNIRKSFRLGPGFWLDGKPVALIAPAKAAPAQPTRTASGSVAVADARAKVALPSRIWVEGRHDAELVEKVWGDDLRVEGVAVEHLGGIDDLASAVTEFAPGPGRKLGVLVDHLVPGSKESRIAAQLAGQPHVLVVGHPFIDVWQSVKPERLGSLGVSVGLERASASSTRLMQQDDSTPITGYPPEAIVIGETRYVLDKRGAATCSLHGDLGGLGGLKKDRPAGHVERCRWWLYGAPGEDTLLVEQWGSDYRVLRGKKIVEGTIELIPGS